MRIGLLIEGSRITRWQANALSLLNPDDEICVYNCMNPPAPKRRFRHWSYYLLNLFSLRTEQTRRISLPSSLRISTSINYKCTLDGAWQQMPEMLIDRLGTANLDVIIKFDNGLLRVPERGRLPIDILSYHHGDPRHFRGRPAGFYEILNGRQTIGQIVQILTNRLDAGQTVAFAETRVYQHSYRQTMREAYTASPLLLPKALAAILDGRTVDLPPEGKATRLPSARTVIRFVAQCVAAKLRRLAYGAFVEKRWQVAHAPAMASDPISLQDFAPTSAWRTVERPPGFSFLADPFPHPTSDGILVEALSSSTGLGEILHISDSGIRTLLSGDGHFSYPASLVTSDGPFLLPEICEWSEPQLYRLGTKTATLASPLKLDVHANLVDPTLFERDGTTFLFANNFAEGDSILRLWVAQSVHDRFQEHPASPILISPRGARMGGLLIERGNSLYRVGQDGSASYGDGLLLFRIDELSCTEFRETLVDELHFTHCRGPHTLNEIENGVVFDFYENRFDFLASIRRLKRRLARRA
jgi:hypothetical protein